MPLTVNTCSIFIQSTYKHLILMQPRYVCTLKMGYCLLSCGWLEMKLNILLQQYTTLLLTSLYVTHKSDWWNVFRENLHFISQSLILQTGLLMWTLQLFDGAYWVTKHVIWKVLVKMLDFTLLSYRRGFWKSGIAALDIQAVTFPTHNCSHRIF
jgi:hypothetical protein